MHFYLWGCEEGPGAQPRCSAQLPPWPSFSPCPCQPFPCLLGSSPRAPTVPSPTREAPPSPWQALPPTARPWTNALQLEPADRLLALSACSLPAQPGPVTSNNSNIKHFARSISAAQRPCLALERQHLAMNSDLQDGCTRTPWSPAHYYPLSLQGLEKHQPVHGTLP